MVWRTKLVRDEKVSDDAWINRRQAFHLIPPSAKANRNYSSYIEVSFDNFRFRITKGGNI
jgi:hypothetical protein